MIEGARRAGLEYVAITDHSKHIGAVHGLDAQALAEQIDAIDRLNPRLTGIEVLKGAEVDVLESGDLALPDEILRRLDVVVIAVHSHFELPRRRQTDRLLRAIDHRYVSVLAHPAARLLGERPPIEVDWARVIERAAARPLYFEINAQPARLDLDDRLAREAAERGALLCISSDAHSASGFSVLRGGVTQARRAWLDADRIVNCRPLAALRPLLARTFV
jgi:DNA polymerase (family 10)